MTLLAKKLPTEFNSTYFLNPEQYIKEENLRRTERELDIATEIFIAQKQAIHYADIMTISNEALASKSKLISWLNDSYRKEKLVRPGIITLYKANNPDHFKDGKWEARNLALFIHYALSCLTDSRIVKKQQNVEIFLDSIQEEEWFVQAVGLMGTKLLEDLFRADALKSKVAYSLLSCTITNRIMLEKIGKIVGRVGKNQMYDLEPSLQNEIIRCFKKQIAVQLEIAKEEEEYKIYKEHERAIKKSLFHVREEVSSPSILALGLG